MVDVHDIAMHAGKREGESILWTIPEKGSTRKGWRFRPPGMHKERRGSNFKSKSFSKGQKFNPRLKFSSKWEKRYNPFLSRESSSWAACVASSCGFCAFFTVIDPQVTKA